MTSVEPLVLLVEDEPPLRRFLRTTLTAHGYRLIEAVTAREGGALARSHQPALVLLDLGLPDGDGIDLTRELRAFSRVPILVLSARGLEDDKIAALDAGADDYLTKPFGVGELLARMRVALRHAEGASAATDAATLSIGPLFLDLDRRLVTVDGREVHLTPIEYKLLLFLARNEGRVLTHRQILQAVWGSGVANPPHYVRVHVAELRKKIEADPARPRLLVTEPGVGYRLRETPSA